MRRLAVGKALTTSIIGNSKTLCSLSDRGNLTSLCYPNIDYAQHIGATRIGVYYGRPGEGWISWNTDEKWVGEQRYVEKTNILTTDLKHNITNLRLLTRSYVVPDDDLVVQHLTITNMGEWAFNGKIFFYAKLNVGEFTGKNTVLYNEDADAILQWKREYWIAVGGDRHLADFQCGKNNDPITALKDAEDGRLMGYPNMFGDVDLAEGWSVEGVAPGGSASLTVYLSCGLNEGEILERLIHARKVGEEFLYSKTVKFWESWLEGGRKLELPEGTARFRPHYDRALLGLRLLYNRPSGAFIAAPVDYDYNYCWHRDASEVVLALLNAGYRDVVEGFFEFCSKSQDRDGSWFHRYWVNGEKAPSWCALYKTNQYDETSTPVFVMASYILNHDKLEYGKKFWPMLKRAAEFLYNEIDTDTKLHKACTDIWEERIGHYTYTASSYVVGLRAAADLAEKLGEGAMAARWREASVRIREAVLERLWDGERRYFVRGLNDPVVDSATLGLLQPFEILNLEREDEVGMALSHLEAVEKTLLRLGGIARYTEDRYRGFENPWLVCTGWLARCLLSVARHLIFRSEIENAERLIEKAVGYLDWCTGHSTATGLLPEQFNGSNSEFWAVPLGWSMANMIQSLILLESALKDMDRAKVEGPIMKYKQSLSEGEYAVIKLIYGRGPLTARDISAEANLPYSGIHQILSSLMRKGLLEIVEGERKTYRLILK